MAQCGPAYARAAMPIPTTARDALERRLDLHRQQRPELVEVAVRARGSFAYVSGVLADGDVLLLCRLCYLGSPHEWGFAVYLVSKDGYEDPMLARGGFTGARRRCPRLRVWPLPPRPVGVNRP